MSFKHYFVSYACCSELKHVSIRGKSFLLYAKLLLSVIAFEVLKFSLVILVPFLITSWIKFCRYSLESPSRDILLNFFLVFHFSANLLCKCKKSTVFAYFDVARVKWNTSAMSVFYKICPTNCYWPQYLSLI